MNIQFNSLESIQAFARQNPQWIKPGPQTAEIQALSAGITKGFAHFRQQLPELAAQPTLPTGGPRPKSLAKLQGAVQKHLHAGFKVHQVNLAPKAQPGKSVQQTNVAHQGQGGSQ